MGLIVGEKGPADLDDQKRVIKRPQCEKRVESTQQGCGWLDSEWDLGWIPWCLSPFLLL